MQVEVDVKCMQINFGGHDISSVLEIMSPFCLPIKNEPKFPFRTMGYNSPWGSKNRIGSKKFMQVEVDVKCMQTNFGGRGHLWFRRLWLLLLAPSKAAKISLQTMGYNPWGSKNLIEQNWLRKFMQVEVDVKCMQTNFGGCGLFWFRRLWLLLQTAFKNGQNFPSDHGL